MQLGLGMMIANGQKVFKNNSGSAAYYRKRAMMNQTLFISDIDGTLLKTGQMPHPSVLRAIAAFRQEGGLFCICTGRTLPAVKNLLPLLPGCSLGILCGGSVVYDFEKNRPLIVHYLDISVVSALKELMAQEPSISVTVSTPDEIYRIRDNTRLLTRGVYEDRTAPVGVLDQIGPMVKVLLTCDDPQLLEAAVARLFPAQLFELHRASTYFYELTAAGINKATGVKALNAMIGNRRVFSAGDAPSDAVMASVSELFFAPKTAMESVREAASWIFPAPEDGGLAETFEKIRVYLKDHPVRGSNAASHDY